MVPVVLSPELLTMQSATRSEDYRSDFSVVYASGQGAGSQRVTVTTSDTARLGASPWARKERFVDARNLKTLDSLNSTAAATLYQGRPHLSIAGVVRDRPGCVFGQHWNYGDLVEASVDGLGASCRVEQVTVEVERGAAPVISVELLDTAAEASAGLSIAQQLEELGASDAATIGTVPEAWGVPQAGADGKLDNGWLHVDLSGVVQKGAGNAAGRVAFFDSATALAGDSGLVWDTTYKRLGVGTSAPNYALHVRKDAANSTDAVMVLDNPNASSSAYSGIYMLNSGGTARYAGIIRSSPANPYYGSYGALTLWTLAADPLVFATTNVTRGMVRSDGPLQWNHKIVIGDDVSSVANALVLAKSNASSELIIGQSSTARFSFAWIYNAVEANAFATFGTATNNPLTVSVWGNEAARWTTGRALLLGKTSGLNGLGDLDAAGYVRSAAFLTSYGNTWQLGGYAGGYLGASGYVNVIIDGVARRLLCG